MVTKNFRTWVLAGLIAAVVGPASAASLREVNIPISSVSFATAALRVAKEMGLFEKHGLDPHFVTMESGNAAIAALIGNSADVALTGPGEIVAARARGQEIVLVADVYRGLSASLVLSKSAAAGSSVAVDAPPSARLKALNGMLIASVSPTSAYTVAFKTATEAVGAKVRFTFMAQPAMAAALEAGAVQGFIAGAPFWGKPVAQGGGILWLSGPKGELPEASTPVSSVSIQAVKSVAAAKSDLMDELIAVTEELREAVTRRPADVKNAVARLYPDLDPATLDLLFATESRAWAGHEYTPADIRHEIAFVKLSGVPLPMIDQVDPADMIFVKK